MRWLLRVLCLCALAVAVAVAPGCSKPGRQWTIEFGTSAVIPRNGDRLTVEILDVNGRPACADCTRDIDLLYGLRGGFIAKGGLTMAVADTASIVRVRARLYRYSTSASATTSAASAIDVVARLPPFKHDETGADIYKNVPFPLPISCLGRPPDLAAGTTCQLGPDNDVLFGPEPTLAERNGDGGYVAPKDSNAPIDCTKPAPAGMACVGAGAFLLGDDRYESLAFDYPSRPEVGFFFAASAALMLDVDEMTVGAVRRLVKDGTVTVTDSGADGLVRKGTNAECTYLGPDDPANDALPLNCVGRNVAAAVCKARGRRLPTEAEWEFAGANGVEETMYPWGNFEDDYLEGISLYDDDAVVCKRAIVGRGREAAGESTRCAKGNGPVAGGSALDVSKAGVKNLGGNLSEWVSGELGLYDEPCWRTGDVCLVPSSKLDRRMAPHRGGSWARDPESAIAVARFARPDGEPSPYVGFRCAVAENELP